jgi:hypothetical protein
VFPNGGGKPVNVRDLMSSVITPACQAKGLVWKGYYSGRCGAGTAVVDLTNGNLAAAQELLRHKHMTTTAQFYKEQTQTALRSGVSALDAALSKRQLTE